MEAPDEDGATLQVSMKRSELKSIPVVGDDYPEDLDFETGQVKHLFPEQQVVEGVEIPHPYELWRDGLYKVSGDRGADDDTAVRPDIALDPSRDRRKGLDRVAHRPVWLARKGELLPDPDMSFDAEELFELTFGTANHAIKRVWAERSTLLDRRKMVNLIRSGAPIKTGNTAQLEDFFDALIHTSVDSLPTINFARRCGPVYENGEPIGFLYGDQWIGDRERSVELYPLVSAVQARGYGVSGDPTEWQTKTQEILAYGAISRWLFASVFAAPLGKLIGQRTFIVHHWGKSGVGKTAHLRFRHAAFGDYKKICLTFNRSPMSFLAVFDDVTGLPLAFDEGQAARGLSLTQFIYSICLEEGRARVSNYGALSRPQEPKFRTVVSTTAEQGIVADDLGGQGARVISLKAPALPSDTVAKDVHGWLESTRDFGWGGYMFLQALTSALKNPDALERLRNRWLDLTYRITGQTDIGSGLASSFGAVALAQTLVYQIIFKWGFDQALDLAVQDGRQVLDVSLTNTMQEESLPDRVMQLLRDHRASHRHRWLATLKPGDGGQLMTADYKELTGVEAQHKQEVWIIPAEFKALLRLHNLPEDRVVTDLVEAGILKVSTRSSGRTIQKLHRQFGTLNGEFYVLDATRFDLPSLLD